MSKSHQTGTITHHWNDLPPTPSPTPSPSPSSPHTFPETISSLFAAPSKLPQQELSRLHARVEKAVGGISEGQKAEVAGIVEGVLAGAVQRGEGRDAVVQFMVRETGVAGWVGAVRRGLECLV
jgi:hypothetical protein